jgi:hypothetical protein
MNTGQIIRYVAVALAVVGAFVVIPEAALIMTIVGLVMGWVAVDANNRTAFLVLAVALATVSGAAGGLPAIGEHISAIMGNASAIITAGALAVIIKEIYERTTA